jgi:hypothetical protein
MSKFGAARTTAAADGETPNSSNRPRSIIIAVGLIVASGIFSVAAGLSLFGAKDFLANKALVERITATQITSTVTAAQNAFDSSKSGNNASKVSGAVTNQLNDAKKDSTAIASGDVSDQAKKASTAAKSATSATALGSTVRGNLTKLRTQEATDAHSQANSAPKQVSLQGLVLLLIAGLLGVSMWRGRYWARWAVLAIWGLSSFTGVTQAGLTSLTLLNVSLPGAFKGLVALCALTMLGAVVLVLLPTSGKFFALTRPVPAAGGQRRGLFAPRVPPQRPAATAPAKPARVVEDPDRARSKKRAATTAQSVAKGADLARGRAKAASKSRRSGSQSGAES